MAGRRSPNQPGPEPTDASPGRRVDAEEVGGRAVGRCHRAGLRSHGRRAAVRRRIHQDGAGVAAGERNGAAHDDGPASAPDSRHAAGPHERRGWIGWRANRKSPSLPPRSAASSATNCWPPSRRMDEASLACRAGQIGAGGNSIPERPAARLYVHLQARAARRRACTTRWSRSKRQEFHQRAAEALETRFPQTVESRPELLAHHFTEAGLTQKAVGYWLQAGLRSKERSADVEAIGHLTKGLALLRDARGNSGARRHANCNSSPRWARAYIAVRGYAAPEVGPTLQRARELCERIGELATAVRHHAGHVGVATGAGRFAARRGPGRRRHGARRTSWTIPACGWKRSSCRATRCFTGANSRRPGRRCENAHWPPTTTANARSSGPPIPATTRASPTATICRWHCGTLATRTRPSSWIARRVNWLERSATRTASAMPSTLRPFSATTAASEPKSSRPPTKR